MCGNFGLLLLLINSEANCDFKIDSLNLGRATIPEDIADELESAIDRSLHEV
jgi:hypothetical protein